MPLPSIVDTLPADVRQALAQKIANNGYARYEEVVAWLKSMGYKTSKTALHRFGQELKARRSDHITEALAVINTPSGELLDLRMRCIEAAVSAGEPDVLQTAQTYFEWVNLRVD